jgi:protein-tyrosine phosphatase
LRKGADPAGKRFGADYWHFPISSNHEKYDTTNSFVRRWLNRIISCLGQNVSRLPVFLHCTSGKDRTGVAIAALLTALGVDREAIVLEYLWSEGEIQRAWIEQALDGIGDPVRYFALLDLAELRDKFLHDSSPQSVP